MIYFCHFFSTGLTVYIYIYIYIYREREREREREGKRERRYREREGQREKKGKRRDRKIDRYTTWVKCIVGVSISHHKIRCKILRIHSIYVMLLFSRLDTIHTTTIWLPGAICWKRWQVTNDDRVYVQVKYMFGCASRYRRPSNVICKCLLVGSR